MIYAYLYAYIEPWIGYTHPLLLEMWRTLEKPPALELQREWSCSCHGDNHNHRVDKNSAK